MDITHRVINEAKHIIKTGDTIRETAKVFYVSKSTVHKDLKERLKQIDHNLYLEITKILDYHTSIRHIKGGESTRKKYLKIKK